MKWLDLILFICWGGLFILHCHGYELPSSTIGIALFILVFDNFVDFLER